MGCDFKKRATNRNKSQTRDQKAEQTSTSSINIFVSSLKFNSPIIQGSLMWDQTKKRKNKLSTSNFDTSLQELIPQLTDLEPPILLEAHTEVQQKTVVPNRDKHRISFYNRIRLRQRINLSRNLDEKVQLEQVDARPYDLSYACLMIPRFTTHYLIGDIAEALRLWMKQICVSFAWRLEYITVHPDYIQWILNVPPPTPPSICIRTIRQQTSLKIFEDFPHFKQQNLSKDFWAPGYFVLVGNRPHPMEMINDYIQLTRQQQGIQPHRSE